MAAPADRVAPAGFGARGAMSRAPAMTDVARMAGVSHQTVSRVLNDHPSVRPATRQRVLEAIERLDYRPNLAARALVTGRSRTLGVVALDTTLFGPVSMLYGIERAAREAGWYVSVVSLRSIDAASLGEALERLALQGVAGVVAITPLVLASAELGAARPNLPVVLVEGDPGGDQLVVTVDQRAGARLATDHLLALGHESVAHVAGPAQFFEAGERVAGWRAALEEAGAAVPEVIEGDWTARSGFEAGRVIAGDESVTAVFVANDHMALGVLRAFSERGRDVPHDVSVVGFDDTDESGYYTPPLTTVHQDFEAVGRRSIELLLRRVGQDGERTAGGRRTGHGERVVIAPRLVVRQSTGPPPAAPPPRASPTGERRARTPSRAPATPPRHGRRGADPAHGEELSP